MEMDGSPGESICGASLITRIWFLEPTTATKAAGSSTHLESQHTFREMEEETGESARSLQVS